MMPTSTPKARALEVSAATAIIVVASFLPWGTVDFTKMSVPGGGSLGEGMTQMFSSLGTVPVTVWNGHASLGGIKLPNSLVLLAGIAIAAFSWLRATCVWKVRPAISVSLAGYGLAHCGYVLISLLFSPEGTPGIGIFLMTTAFAWILVALLRREAEHPT